MQTLSAVKNKAKPASEPASPPAFVQGSTDFFKQLEEEDDKELEELCRAYGCSAPVKSAKESAKVFDGVVEQDLEDKRYLVSLLDRTRTLYMHLDSFLSRCNLAGFELNPDVELEFHDLWEDAIEAVQIFEEELK
jgi:hypothetical protein